MFVKTSRRHEQGRNQKYISGGVFPIPYISFLPPPLPFPRLEVAPQIQLRNLRECCYFPP